MECNMTTEMVQHVNDGFPDLENCEWGKVTLWLRACISSSDFSVDIVRSLLNIIRQCLDKFTWYSYLEREAAEALIETLRHLRICVTKEHISTYLIEEPSFYDIMNKLMNWVFTKKNAPELYTKYLLQLFINLISGGSENERAYKRKKIREHEMARNFHYLFYNGFGCLYEVSALLYNLYSDMELNDKEFVTHILQHYSEKTGTNEFLEFLFEKVVSQDFVWEIYGTLLPSHRLVLLQSLHEFFIQRGLEKLLIDIRKLPASCLKCLMQMFKGCPSVIFQITHQGDESVIEVSYTLQLIAQLSSESDYLNTFQSNKDILISAGVLLINVHNLGKQSNNAFSPLQKLAEIQHPSSLIRNSPVFGFKADLVRLIGNLCWKNREMQDLAREGELIPVLLDCCNIDARNPFIMQWVILAIRNICENNRENQAIIAGLSQQGAVSSEVLQEFGLTLHSEEDLSLGIVGLNLNK